MNIRDDNDMAIHDDEDMNILEASGTNRAGEGDEEEQLELNDEDLRELERMGEDLIPEILKNFTVDNGWGETIPARTTDFSEKGLRLAIDGKHSFKSDDIILLTTLAGNIQLAGQVKYCLKTNTPAGTSYLGIYLQKTHSINEYIRLINTNIKKTGS